jgi:hypothetical protein
LPPWNPAVLGKIPAKSPESGLPESSNSDRTFPDFSHFCQNSANPDSDKTVRIPAFIPDSGNSSRNQVKMVGILPVSDGISSPVIFILFCINIYLL